MTVDKGAYASRDDYTPLERAWLAGDWRDPRADCPQRDQHAHRMYGSRWSESTNWANTFPKLDGRSVAKTHKQVRCEGCKRFAVWLPKTTASADSDAS